MSFVGRIVGALLRPILERQARGRSLGELAEALEIATAAQTAALAEASDTPANREAANHVIGIERWGQRRLRVGLGESFVADGHRPYRLPDEASMAELRNAFADTRRDTVALARELERAAADPARTVRHNDFGELSLGGWLAYLDSHAKRELKRLRG